MSSEHALLARHAARVPSQLMGELPKARVRPSLPFERAGVDCAGPINVRLSKTREKGTMKGYIAIFVCIATRELYKYWASIDHT